MSNYEVKFFNVNEKKKIYEFPQNRYIKIKTLGEGSFGKVILVKKENPDNEGDSKYFALKISKRFKKISKNKNLADVDDEKDKEEKPKELNFIELRELVIMKKIKKHPNIIDLVDFKMCKEERQIWILMDYIPTELGKFLYKNKNNPEIMNENFFKNISYQILCGVNHLHLKQIIHRDLKLENILYDEKKKIVRIGDFGLSRQYDYDINSQYTDVGTYPYKPPELILGLTHYSTSFDIWSLGCILVEICTGAHLFGKDNSIGVIKLMYEIFGSFNDKVLPGHKNFPKSYILESLEKKKGIGLINYIKKNKKFEFENNNFYDLIEKMLCLDPTKRINAKECLNHCWFSDLKN